MLREGLILNFIPMKFKELLAEKRREELSRNKIVTIYMSYLCGGCHRLAHPLSQGIALPSQTLRL
jgi:hypothetical protein